MLSTEPANEIDGAGLAHPLQPFRRQYCADMGEACVHVAVDEDIIIFRPMADLGLGAGHAPGDDIVRIGTARAQAALQLRHRRGQDEDADRSEEHTSELQSLMRISYAVFCLTKKTTKARNT